ncbi:MAG: hypothetical protein OHK0039_19190 [Bacteroidia bacterium]
MTIKHPNLLLLLLFVGTGLSLQAQEDVYYVNTFEGETSVCVWGNIILHEVPGRNSRNIGEIVYAEELTHLGKEALVRSEKRNYIWVRTRDGKTGWVNETYVVRNGGVVVVLTDATIYGRPETFSSATDQQFAAGEILVLSDFQNDWVFLTGIRKEKSGWIKGYEKLSVETGDIETATMLARAQAEPDLETRRSNLQKLMQFRSGATPEMMAVVRNAYNATLPQPAPTNPSARPAVDDQSLVYYDVPFYEGGEDAFSNATSRPAQTSAQPVMPLTPAPPAYQRIEREVIDMETGKSYVRVYESGTIQPVKAKNPPSIYYCYHKTLPIGTKVLLSVPGYEGKYVPLEVIARLRPDNSHMLGLGGEVIKAVFGEIAAKDVASVTISYPQY